METPYGGRAVFNDTVGGLEISIPTRRNWFIILFLGAWLGGWVFGECFALGSLTGILGKMGSADLFMLFWLCGWTVGGFFAFRMFLWNLNGKEVISIGQGQLTLDKKGALFFKAKTYDLKDAKDFRVQNDDYSYNGFGGLRGNNFWTMNMGTIRFDYGLQTVKFAGGIDEAEAKFILKSLTDRKILTEKNFAES